MEVGRCHQAWCAGCEEAVGIVTFWYGLEVEKEESKQPQGYAKRRPGAPGGGGKYSVQASSVQRPLQFSQREESRHGPDPSGRFSQQALNGERGRIIKTDRDFASIPVY